MVWQASNSSWVSRGKVAGREAAALAARSPRAWPGSISLRLLPVMLFFYRGGTSRDGVGLKADVPHSGSAKTAKTDDNSLRISDI